MVMSKVEERHVHLRYLALLRLTFQGQIREDAIKYSDSIDCDMYNV
jgi:hypothetical protein